MSSPRCVLTCIGVALWFIVIGGSIIACAYDIGVWISKEIIEYHCAETMGLTCILFAFVARLVVIAVAIILACSITICTARSNDDASVSV